MESIVRGLSLVTLLALASGTSPLARAQGAGPHLEHGAPWLGSDLTLAVVGAPPHTLVRLLESDVAGALATPYGLLELERTSVHVVAAGQSDASGRFEASLPIPLDPALAETFVHYQALVDDATAPAGAVLTAALHLRRVGPRFYAGSQGIGADVSAGPEPGGLAIVSAVTREVVATVDYGVPASGSPATSTDAQPVFADDLSRGAVMASPTRLILFDPFTGANLGTLAFESSSRKLARGARGAVFVLSPGQHGAGQPARLHAVDLATATVVSTLELPRASTGQWIWNRDRDEVVVVELDGDPAWRYLRRISLQGPVDLGAVALGGQGSLGVTGLASSGDLVLAGTFDSDLCSGGGGGATLTRIDYGSAPPLVQHVQPSGSSFVLTPVPAVGTLVAFEANSCFVPGGRIAIRMLGTLGLRAHVQLPVEFSDAGPNDIEWEPGRLWMSIPKTFDGLQGLLWLELPSLTWTTFLFPPGTGPRQVELVHDALVHTGAVVSLRTLPPPGFHETTVTFIDPLSGAFDPVTILGVPESLLGVGLP